MPYMKENIRVKKNCRIFKAVGELRLVLCRLISFSANVEPGLMDTPIDYYKAHAVFGEGAMHVQCVP